MLHLLAIAVFFVKNPYRALGTPFWRETGEWQGTVRSLTAGRGSGNPKYPLQRTLGAYERKPLAYHLIATRGVRHAFHSGLLTHQPE